MCTHTNFGFTSEERASPHSPHSEVEETVNLCRLVCSVATMSYETVLSHNHSTKTVEVSGL